MLDAIAEDQRISPRAVKLNNITGQRMGRLSVGVNPVAHIKFNVLINVLMPTISTCIVHLAIRKICLDCK